MIFTENFAFFNLLKLLSGISQGLTGSKAQESADNPSGAVPRAESIKTDPPAPREKNNVMADVIERHERIANRVKDKSPARF